MEKEIKSVWDQFEKVRILILNVAKSQGWMRSVKTQSLIYLSIPKLFLLSNSTMWNVSHFKDLSLEQDEAV